MSNTQANHTRNLVLKPHERMILCCSSTRHRRFIDDLIRVMALPSGSRVRLRYGDTVCDPAVRKLGDQISPSLVGLRVLIAHVGFDQATTQFLPLRVGSVVELRTVGSVTFLEIELGDFVEGQQNTDLRDLLTPIAPLKLPTQAPSENKPSGYFCQILSSPAALSCGHNTDLWERVGTRFLSAIGNSNAAFPFIFHIDVLLKRSRKPVSLRNGTLIAPAISQIELHLRTLSTQSSFDSIIQTPVGTLTIVADHPDARLSSGERHPIDTTRNLLVSRLTTNISLRPAYGGLTVTASRCHPKAVVSRVPVAPLTELATEATGEATVVATTTEPRADPVDEVTVELPLAVGRPGTRLAAIAFISTVLAVHAFDIGELAEHADYVWWKAIAVFAAAFIALFMGLKPQAGS